MIIHVNVTGGEGHMTAIRQPSANFRLDSFLDNGFKVKALLNVSNIDQENAGSSRLLEDDYKNHPTRAGVAIYQEVIFPLEGKVKRLRGALPRLNYLYYFNRVTCCSPPIC